MNNYSMLQRILHRISLSPSFMREISFDFEQFFLSKSYPFEDNHVFVSGLARSGTTILLRAIHASEEFASLSYADMPFVLAPNLWGKFNQTTIHKQEQERAHADGIMVSTNSPEAFEEVYWKTFSEQNAKEHFKIYIQLILKKYQKHRYLSKNNQNIIRLKTIIKLLPNSQILIPFREPFQQTNSLLSQHSKFSKAQKKDKFIKNYMDWIGHSEFGLSYRPIINNKISYKDTNSINHWLEQWLLVYSELRNDFENQKNVNFVCYESLCINKTTWMKIKNILEIKKDYNVDFKGSKKHIKLECDQSLLDKCKYLYNDLECFSI